MIYNKFNNNISNNSINNDLLSIFQIFNHVPLTLTMNSMNFILTIKSICSSTILQSKYLSCFESKHQNKISNRPKDNSTNRQFKNNT